MAFSILRHSLRLYKNPAPARSVLENVLQNAKMANMESVKNMVTKCKCVPLVVTTLQNVAVRSYSKHAKHHHERTYLSSSESDSDLEEWIGHRGESEFWRRKIRTFHSILDINKDGVIAFDDFKLIAERFVALGNLSEKQIVDFNKIMKELWENQFGEISPYNLVPVEKYLENMHHVLNDKRLVRKAHSFLPFLFKAVDKDKSGEITVQEFKQFFTMLGLKEQDAILAFSSIDSNGDGRISKKEFVRHGRDFFLTEDEDRISKYFWGPLIDH